jgi:hypothetical protein
MRCLSVMLLALLLVSCRDEKALSPTAEHQRMIDWFLVGWNDADSTPLPESGVTDEVLTGIDAKLAEKYETNSHTIYVIETDSSKQLEVGSPARLCNCVIVDRKTKKYRIYMMEKS